MGTSSSATPTARSRLRSPCSRWASPSRRGWGRPPTPGGTVDGHPAMWVSRGVSPELVWEYKPGAWASLLPEGASKAEATRIADSAQFGTQDPIPLPFHRGDRHKGRPGDSSQPAVRRGPGAAWSRDVDGEDSRCIRPVQRRQGRRQHQRHVRIQWADDQCECERTRCQRDRWARRIGEVPRLDHLLRRRPVGGRPTPSADESSSEAAGSEPVLGSASGAAEHRPSVW